MRRTARAALGVVAAVATLGLVGPAASAGVISISEAARAPELSLGDSGRAAGLFRFAGPDRVRTAARAAATVSYAPSHTSLGKVAILAGSGTFADALAAAPLAESLSAPVLLASADGTLSEPTIAQLERHDTVVIASGRSVVPEAAAAALRERGVEVIRYAGASRYDTAAVLGLASVYWAGVAAGNGTAPGAVPETATVYLADGESFPDALTAGPAAGRDGHGLVLLTTGDTLAPVSESVLAGRPGAIRGVDADAIKPLLDWWGSAPPKVVVRTVGGAATAAAEAADVSVATKLMGQDRYATAAAVAEYGLRRGLFSRGFVIASGESFADGVVGGAFGANLGAPLLLTERDRLPGATIAAIGDNAVNSDTVAVFGGEASVSRAVSAELAGMFSW